MKKIPALLGLVLLAGCGRSTSNEAHEAPAAAPAAPTSGLHLAKALLDSGRVQTAPVRVGAARGQMVLAATVLADEAGEAEITTLVSGRVASILVADGDRVSQGQVLAWIDAPEVARASAELLRARGRAEQAARSLQRQEQLAGENATSKNALDDARANDAAARADLLAARSLLRSYGAQEPAATAAATPLRLAVRAPIAGVVAERFTALGSPVTPDKALFHVVAPERIMVMAKLPETSSVQPQEGDTVSLRPREEDRGSARACRGTVSRVIRVVDAERQQRVRIQPAAECQGLSAGRFVNAVFDTGASTATGLVVPETAVVEVKGASVVFVQTAEETFAPRSVRLGVGTARDRVIEEGVVEGERVVVEGAVLLKGELLRAELGE